jgi:PAS domain S-box-containing protein
MEELAALAFEHAPAGIVLTEHRIIRACNAQFCALSGRAQDELIGRSFRVLYADDAEYDSIRDIGLSALAAGASYSDQRLLRRRDGGAVWCRFRAKTLTPDDPLARTILVYAAIADGGTHPGLTPRERDVVLLLSRGMTSKEIGRQLGLSSRSIEDVRARLLKKFEVHNAAQLLERLRNLEA